MLLGQALNDLIAVEVFTIKILSRKFQHSINVIIIYDGNRNFNIEQDVFYCQIEVSQKT